MNDLPLPKPGVKGDSYVVKAMFANALNLPQRAKVRVAGADVGVVTDIKASNFQAEITMQISTDVTLPVTTTAQLRQATPLGDIFVALSKPAASAGQPQMRDGDTIAIDHTSAGATVEELLLTLSTLFNGGAFQRVGQILNEMDSVLSGRGPQVAHLIKELTYVVGGLHRNSAKIDGVLGQLDTTLRTFNSNKAALGQVADSMPGLVSTLAENNQKITHLLGKISVTSAALGDFANTSGDQLTQMVESTTRLMGAVAQAKGTLSTSLDQMHAMYPRILSSMRGSGLATTTTISYLTLSGLYDPGSRMLPGLTDGVAFFGSLAQVLQNVYGRLTSKPGPAPTPLPWTPPAPPVGAVPR